LTTSLGYIPQTRAPAPTLLRHLAYIEGPDAQLAGPEADPDGWHVLPSVNVKGMMFETREVEMECTVGRIFQFFSDRELNGTSSCS
jgi:hypothetical protein